MSQPNGKTLVGLPEMRPESCRNLDLCLLKGEKPKKERMNQQAWTSMDKHGQASKQASKQAGMSSRTLL